MMQKRIECRYITVGARTIGTNEMGNSMGLLMAGFGGLFKMMISVQLCETKWHAYMYTICSIWKHYWWAKLEGGGEENLPKFQNNEMNNCKRFI